jgi:hypothetical protein
MRPAYSCHAPLISAFVLVDISRSSYLVLLSSGKRHPGRHTVASGGSDSHLYVVPATDLRLQYYRRADRRPAPPMELLWALPSYGWASSARWWLRAATRNGGTTIEMGMKTIRHTICRCRKQAVETPKLERRTRQEPNEIYMMCNRLPGSETYGIWDILVLFCGIWDICRLLYCSPQKPQTSHQLSQL